MHLCLDQATPVVAAPLFPDGTAQSFFGAKGFVASLDAGTLLRPRLPIAANRNDRGGSVCLNRLARLLSGASAGFMPLREAVG